MPNVADNIENLRNRTTNKRPSIEIVKEMSENSDNQ